MTHNLVRIHNAVASAPRAKKTLMVASGKGGVGKTWFSITLAHTLVRLHKRVLLFDGDLGLANVDIQLGLNPEKDLGTVLTGQSSLKEAITPYQEGFDILAGRSGCSSLAGISLEKVWGLLQMVKTFSSQYDFLILDAGAGIGDTVKSMARFADMGLVLVTDEPTSLTDAYALIKVLHTSFPALTQQVIINQAESIPEGEKVFETLKRVSHNFLGYQPGLAGVIRRDKRVKDAICHQTPLRDRFHQAPAALDVEKIAKGIIEGNAF